jgi:hypothetical protein
MDLFSHLSFDHLRRCYERRTWKHV